MPLDSQGLPNFGELKTFLLELSQMDIAEFELEYRDIRISVRKNGFGAARKPKPAPLEPPPEPAASTAPGTLPITSPLTGVFFLKASPTAPPFVQEGDDVEEGQVVGLVEAMKVFNEIKVEWPGRVVRICARNGELVQVGQILIELAPLS